MRLAPDPIVIRIGGEGITLSPSLRAAMRIARKHGDFRKPLNDLLAGNLTTIAELIREGSEENTDLADLIADAGLAGLGFTLTQLRAPLIEFVLALAGIDADEPVTRTTSPSGKPLSLADYHSKLFEIATGWLGWSPVDAWTATPAEIEAAFRGRTDMLKAILGASEQGEGEPSPEQRAAMEAAGLDPDFNRAGLQALKHKNRAHL